MTRHTRHHVLLSLDQIGCLKATVEHQIRSAQLAGATEYQTQLEGCLQAILEAIEDICRR